MTYMTGLMMALLVAAVSASAEVEPAPAGCFVQGDSCCIGDVCASAIADCVGTDIPTFYGCNSDCIPDVRCEPADAQCVQQGDSCCKGDVCASAQLLCKLGTYAECRGCDADCTPICQCVPQGTATTSMWAAISTDKPEYNIGETAQVTFRTTFYTVSEDPDMSATAYYPSGSSKQLDLSGSCSEVVSEPCAPGVKCVYPTKICEYKAKISVTEKGEYSVTGVAVVEGASARASASFSTSGQSGDTSLKMNLYVDSDIQVGKSGRITATVSTDNPNLQVGSATVRVGITPPNGETRDMELTRGSCVTPACDCPVYAADAGIVAPSGGIVAPSAGCVCTYGQSCEYTGYYTPFEKGWYSIKAKAEASGKGGPPYTATASAGFNAVSGGDVIYVRLDQKFGIKVSQTAEVVDYNSMRLTLEGIGGDKCMGCVRYANFMVSQSGGAGAPTAVARISVEEGQTVETIDGLKVTCHELGDSDGTFSVSGKESRGTPVAVKISPSQSSVRLGEMAKYDLVIRDMHEGGRSTYTYLIKVGGIPFVTEYEKEVTVGANSEVTVPLYVYTSRYGALDEDEKEPVELTGSGSTIAPKPANYEELIAAKAALAETATDVEVSEAVLTVEKVAVSPTQVAPGRAYKFTVYVGSEGGSQATASAILNILYESPPPPPTDTLKLRLEQGWNLIALPGEGKLSKGSCTSVDELYAFVYVKEKGEYMSMEQAKAYMGDARLAEYLRENSFWAYSFRDCSLEFSLRKATSFQDISLAKGWNFVPITQDMQGNTLSGIAGDCDFEKLYYWNAGAQDWAKMDMSGKLGSSNYPLYTGFVAKATESCGFGWGAILSPPPLPE